MSPVLLVIIYFALLALAGWMTEVCLRGWLEERSGTGADGFLGAGAAARLRGFWLIPYALLSLLSVAGAFLPDSPAKFALQAAGNVWLGFYVYYGALLGLLLAAMLAARLISGGRIARRWHGGILCTALVVSLAVGSYGLVHAQDTVVTRWKLSLDKPGEDLRVVLLGDLHLSVNSRLETTRRMVELVNAENPDLVLVAGDVFTSSYEGLSRPEAYAETLRAIESKYGVYAVYGNHDVEETLFGGFPISPISQAFRTAEMERFFDDCGFITLADQVVTLDNGIQLAGRIDGEKAGDGTTNRMSPEALLTGADPSRPILVLQHEPRGFQALAEAGADVALCGHTHAGQIFPGNLIIPLFNENAWGYKQLHGLDTFVTSGVGYYGPPMLVGTDSVVMAIVLPFKSEDGET